MKRVSDASYKLEVGGDDEALLGRSYASNYSVNRLNKPQFQFGNFLASYEKAPSFHSSDASILGSINTNSEIISALPFNHPVHQKSGNCVNFHSNNELQINIDQQSCYEPNRQHLSQDELLLPPSNLSLIQDLQDGGILDDSPFSSVYDDSSAFDMIATQQPFNLNPTHLHTNPSHQLNIQNQAQVLFLTFNIWSQFFCRHTLHIQSLSKLLIK